MVTALVLESPRLLLRDYEAEDWQAVYAYASQPLVCQFLAWEPHTPEASRAHVEERIALAKAQPRIEFHLAVVSPPTKTVIGEVGLVMRSLKIRRGELSYILNPAYWGYGFATEMASTLLFFGFATLDLQHIIATCDPRNSTSARVLQKLGMCYEGRIPEAIRMRDRWRDSDIYHISRHAWQQQRLRK